MKQILKLLSVVLLSLCLFGMHELSAPRYYRRPIPEGYVSQSYYVDTTQNWLGFSAEQWQGYVSEYYVNSDSTVYLDPISLQRLQAGQPSLNYGSGQPYLYIDSETPIPGVVPIDSLQDEIYKERCQAMEALHDHGWNYNGELDNASADEIKYAIENSTLPFSEVVEKYHAAQSESSNSNAYGQEITQRPDNWSDRDSDSDHSDDSDTNSESQTDKDESTDPDNSGENPNKASDEVNGNKEKPIDDSTEKDAIKEPLNAPPKNDVLTPSDDNNKAALSKTKQSELEFPENKKNHLWPSLLKYGGIVFLGSMGIATAALFIMAWKEFKNQKHIAVPARKTFGQILLETAMIPLKKVKQFFARLRYKLNQTSTSNVKNKTTKVLNLPVSTLVKKRVI